MKLIDRLSPLFLAVVTALLAIAAGVALNHAYAAPVTVTWALPTANTDGSAIPSTGQASLVSTKVEYGTCSGTAFGAKSGEVVVNVPATTATLEIAPASNPYCFRAAVTNAYGNQSAWSNVASKTVPLPPPPPPVVPNAPVLSTTITVAYDLRGISRDGTVLLGRAVGTVDLGTPCIDYAYATNKGTYHMVDRSNVKLVREPRSPAVVTKCAIG